MVLDSCRTAEETRSKERNKMTIDFNSSKAIYLQLADHIRESIMNGSLKAGESIPSVRNLSAEYRINPQTILNATQILVNEGLLEKRRGMGYYVSALAQDTLTESGIIEFQNHMIPDLVKKARILDIPDEELLDMIRNELNK